MHAKWIYELIGLGRRYLETKLFIFQFLLSFLRLDLIVRRAFPQVEFPSFLHVQVKSLVTPTSSLPVVCTTTTVLQAHTPRKPSRPDMSAVSRALDPVRPIAM
jgi:hypothetical protein